MNLSRIKNCMRRAKAGEHLTLGFLGGSITEGSLSSSPEKCYAYLVAEWWKETFPQAEFSYVNGGIGGTTSHYGVARAVTDVLMYRPDFVVVDFSVNDEPNAFYQETYEGLLRKMLGWSSAPAVLLLNNVYYDTGKSAQDYHNAVGDYYQIPHVSIKNTLYSDMLRGKYKREELTQDGLHPNDRGHFLVARQITGVLEQIRALGQGVGGNALLSVTAKDASEFVLPEPMTKNAYTPAVRIFLDFLRIPGKRKGIWIILRTAGSARRRETAFSLRWRLPVSLCSTENRCDIRRCPLCWCLTGMRNILSYSMESSGRTGGTVSIWNRYCTTGRERGTRWR